MRENCRRSVPTTARWPPSAVYATKSAAVATRTRAGSHRVVATITVCVACVRSANQTISAATTSTAAMRLTPRP